MGDEPAIDSPCHPARREERARRAERDALLSKDAQAREARMRAGLWHDGRIDAVCGNGVMSELGVGVERFTLGDTDATASAAADVDGVDEKAAEREAEEARRRQERSEDVRAVEAMPVVVIKNFESRGGGARKAELLGLGEEVEDVRGVYRGDVAAQGVERGERGERDGYGYGAAMKCNFKVESRLGEGGYGSTRELVIGGV